MLTGMELMSCPNLAVPAEVMQHIVHVESSANPFAIGVVGGQLMRQPQNLAEAMATVKMLDAKGYNYSLGIAQVNRSNFARYGLDSYTKAFDTCANLSAGAHILADCYARAKGNWGDAFSCYYSGDFKTGYRDGYVQKVYTSIEKDTEDAAQAEPIPLLSQQAKAAPVQVRQAAPVRQTPGYLSTLRSVAVDTASAAVVRSVAASASRTVPIHDTSMAPAAPPIASATGSLVKKAAAQAAPKAASPASPVGLFTPQVQGPNDPVTAQGPDASTVAEAAPAAATGPDQANTQKEPHDAAFVF